MTTNSQLVTVANENFVASYVKLVEHCTGSEARRIGGVFAFATGLPISLFNGCVVVEPSAPTDLDDAIDWVAAHLVPYRVFVSPRLAAELAPVPAAHGLQRDPLPYPGMVLHPIPEPPEPAAGVAVTPVDASGREDFLAVGEALGLQPDLAESLFPRSLFGDEEVQPFVGRLDGRPGRLLARHREPTRGRRLQRGHAACRASTRCGDCVDVGGGRGRSQAWARLRSAPVVGDGGLDVRGDGLPDRDALRGVQTARPGAGYVQLEGALVSTASPTGQLTPVPPRPQ